MQRGGVGGGGLRAAANLTVGAEVGLGVPLLLCPILRIRRSQS